MPALIIGTYFKRPQAPVEFTNKDGSKTKYYFVPVDPNNPDSEHVCAITDPKHQAKLLAIEEGYYISEAQKNVEAASVVAEGVKRPSTPVPAPVSQTVPAAPVAPPVDPPAAVPVVADPAAPANPSDATTEAHALLAISKLHDFKKAVAAAPKNVLQAALELENGKLDDEIRPTYVKSLQAALKG